MILVCLLFALYSDAQHNIFTIHANKLAVYALDVFMAVPTFVCISQKFG